MTGVVDGLFSSALSVFAYGSTVSRLFQGVASVPLGPAAFDGGAPTVALGLVMHFGVAFGWSAVFLLLVTRSAWIRGVLISYAWRHHGRSRLWTLHLDGDVAGGHSPLHPSSPGDHVSLVGPVLRPLSVRRVPIVASLAVAYGRGTAEGDWTLHCRQRQTGDAASAAKPHGRWSAADSERVNEPLSFRVLGALCGEKLLAVRRHQPIPCDEKISAREIDAAPSAAAARRRRRQSRRG